MKKIKRLLAIAAALAIVCAFAGCNKNDGDKWENSADSALSEESVQKSTDPIVGQWKSEKLPDYVYTFNADGTGKYDMAGNFLDLKYTTEDGKITITFLADGYTPVTLNYELDGDRLNIKDSFGNDTFYVRVKE